MLQQPNKFHCFWVENMTSNSSHYGTNFYDLFIFSFVFYKFRINL